MSDFERIYQQYVSAVFRLAVRCVRRPEIAEEITAEAFLALHENLAAIDTDQLPAWLFTVVKRRAADYWRRAYREQPNLEEQKPCTPVTNPELKLDDLLRRCSNLKPVHRVCIILRFVHGMTRKEIAETTGLDELQVKGHLQYALKLLRAVLLPADGKG